MEMRSRDWMDINSLRRRVAELEIENRRLQALKEPVQCGECRFCKASPEGVFRRCAKQGMRVVGAEGFCEEGKRKNQF